MLGGDLNCNIQSNNAVALLILDAFASIGAFPSVNFLQEKSGLTHSFFVLSTNACSLIDFFFLSTNLGKAAVCFEILQEPSNFSDHLPIKINIGSKSFNDCFRMKPKLSTSNSAASNIVKLFINWDANSDNKLAYYESTRIMFF